jgi:hypothetical protein
MRECELFVCTRMREAAPVTPVAPGSEKFLWAKHIIMKFCCRHSKNLHWRDNKEKKIQQDETTSVSDRVEQRKTNKKQRNKKLER